MLDFPYLYCKLCQGTFMKLFHWGTLILNNGREEILDKVCIKCYEALINDAMINNHSCEKCQSDCLVLIRENYDLTLNKRKFRNYREYVQCNDCDNTFALETQKTLEHYRILLAKKTPSNKKLPSMM
jgi:hypothetical protein